MAGWAEYRALLVSFPSVLALVIQPSPPGARCPPLQIFSRSGLRLWSVAKLRVPGGEGCKYNVWSRDQCSSSLGYRRSK
ncbi:hypothetical protein LXA43DRAFT_1031117 [Ganoderma leucocontextum]|nr:hypothetical protein LXA43DRAFT_1031117 [Ganoderma leucocontextum]